MDSTKDTKMLLKIKSFLKKQENCSCPFQMLIVWLSCDRDIAVIQVLAGALLLDRKIQGTSQQFINIFGGNYKKTTRDDHLMHPPPLP